MNEEEEGERAGEDEDEHESLGDLLERITAAAADRRTSTLRPKRQTASSGKTATTVATTGKGRGGGPLVSDAAPDDWIKDYVAGRSVPTPYKGAGRSTVWAK